MGIEAAVSGWFGSRERLEETRNSTAEALTFAASGTIGRAINQLDVILANTRGAKLANGILGGRVIVKNSYNTMSHAIFPFDRCRRVGGIMSRAGACPTASDRIFSLLRDILAGVKRCEHPAAALGINGVICSVTQEAASLNLIQQTITKKVWAIPQPPLFDLHIPKSLSFRRFGSVHFERLMRLI